MKPKLTIEQLLRWRLARAEAEAPPPPRATFLLELAQPSWEIWPACFQPLVERLSQIQISYGHALAGPRQPHPGPPVPALIVRAGEERETVASVLYLSVRQGRLRLRFLLDAASAQAQEQFEATFIANDSERPLFSTPAILCLDCEYRIDTELSEELSRSWKQLKATARMPFRLILRSGHHQEERDKNVQSIQQT
ncbi:MAG: hypothetical protein ACLQVY_16215 [Limisphaerales bacterium]